MSKVKVENVNKNFVNDDLKQSRVITGEIQLKRKKIELINIYVPNGNQLKQKNIFIKKLVKKFISSLKKKLLKNSNLLIAGDFNIIPEEIDVYDFKRYENDALGKLEIRKIQRTNKFRFQRCLSS